MERPALNKRFATKYTGVFYRILKSGEKSYAVRLKNGNEKTIKPSANQPKINAEIAYQQKIILDEDIRRGYWEEQTKSERMRFKDLVGIYLKQNQLSPAVSMQNEKILYNQLSSRFLNLELKEIKQYDLAQECVRIVSNVKLKNVTKNHYINVLLAVINTGKKNQLFKNNIETRFLPKAKITSQEQVRKRYLSTNEMKIVLSDQKLKNNEMFFCFFILLVYTAGRGKSIHQIKPKDIDIKSRTITLIDTKNNNERYTIPIQEMAIKRVMQLVEKNKIKSNEYVFNIGKLNESEFQISWRKLHGRLIRVLHSIARKNRLELVGLGLHAIRKGVAVAMREAGVSSQVISKFLNHSTTHMTDKHYALVTEKAMQNEIKQFSFDFEA